MTLSEWGLYGWPLFGAWTFISPHRADLANDPLRPQLDFGVIRSWVDGGVQIPVTSCTGLYDRCSTHDLHDHTHTHVVPFVSSLFYSLSHGASTHPTYSPVHFTGSDWSAQEPAPIIRLRHPALRSTPDTTLAVWSSLTARPAPTANQSLPQDWISYAPCSGFVMIRPSSPVSI